METDQRLNLNSLQGKPFNHQNSTLSNKKNQKQKNCFVRLVKGFLQAILHFLKLYRYNDRWDFLLLIVGVITSIGTGFGLPLFAVVAGETIDAFDQTPQILADQADENKNYLLIIGFSMFALGSISFSAWMYLGERISMKFREKYLRGLMKQQIQFFEGSDEQQIYGRFEEHMRNIKEASGLKAGTLIYIAASFLIAGKIATQNGFFLSLIMIPTLPILGVSGFLFSIFVQLKSTKLMRLYAKAEEKVRQSMSFLRTVKELNGQNHEVRLFQEYLKFVKQRVIIYSVLAGLGAGIFSLMQFLVYCLAFWVGSHCVQGTSNCGGLEADQRYTPGDVILIFFAFFVRLDSMQQLFPALKRIYNGTSSYEQIYKIISRKPLVCCPYQKIMDRQIDFRTMKLVELVDHMKTKAGQWKKRISNLNDQSPKLSQNYSHQQARSKENFERLKIQFQNVTLFSKKDSQKKILDDLTFTIDKQLVGLNGQAQEKQAILQLILRLYDPDKGSIFINGVDIKTLNLSHLRRKIGYLDEKTYIFQTNIKENITMGNKQITDQMIWTVLEEIQVAETIKLLDEQLYSEVGFEGKKLGHRLKRQIILARILIKNPDIILFKEEEPFFSQDQQTKFYLNLDNFKQQKLLIYAGNNERTLKKAEKIFVLSMGKIEAEGDFYSLSDYYHEQVTIKQEIVGQKLINDELYKSGLRTSRSLRSSGAMNINQIDTLTDITETSPQKMQLIQEESHFIKYKGKVHKRLFRYLKGNLLIYILGFIVCLVSGILYPLFTIFMSDILLDTFEFKQNENQDSFVRQKINNPILFILWIGIVSFFVNFLQVFIFSVIAQKMGEKLRLQTLRKVLKLPLQWFEISPLRTSFRISQTIKMDPTIVQNLLTNFYSIIIKNTSSFIAGIVIAFVYEWRLALLGFIVLPMMMLSGYLSVIFYRNQLNLNEKQYINSAEIVTESILNMKAIHTQGFEQIIIQKYKNSLIHPLKKAKKSIFLCSMVFGLSQLLIFISYTIMFFFGTMFYRDNSNISTLHLLTAIFAVIWSGWTSGANFIRLPDKKSCEIAASNLFFLLDELDEEESQINEKSKLLRQGIRGNIEFKDVTIKFPEKGFYIDKVNFKIEEKQQIAIFSTTNVDIKPIIDLLYRFEQPQEGTIYVDNNDIKDYEISYLRSSLGVIREEPVIFKGTLRENIIYNKQKASDAQIVSACKITNTISIIDGKEILQQTQGTMSEIDQNSNTQWNGFETMLEPNMKMLTNGQKQRISMARVMLGNPKILLINDEVYSMRYIYENLYREAIRNIITSRTSIFMPHHSENLEAANVIMVLERDKIIQVGRYSDLLKNKSLIKRIKRNYFNAYKKSQIVKNHP